MNRVSPIGSVPHRSNFEALHTMRNRYLTANEVAEVLRLNVETIYDMVGRGELPASKIRGRWRFDAAEIRDWFREQRSTQVTEGREE